MMTNLTRAIFLTATLFGVSVPADADEVAPPVKQQQQNHKHRKGGGKDRKEIFAACAKANNVEVPEKGSGQKLSAGDKSALHSCVQRYRDDMKSCLGDAGLGRGEHKDRKDPAVQRAFKDCHAKSLALISGN